jgi:hypothetical protein
MAMKVTVSGEQRTIAQLKAFDNEAYKRITKALRKAGEGVRDEARTLTPGGNALSNWGKWLATDAGRWVPLAAGERRNLGYSGGDVRSKIGVSLSQDKKNWGLNLFFVRIVTMDHGGAAYSLSGSKRKRASSGKPYQGISFVDNLNRKHGTEYPRGLLPAVKRKGPAARPLLEAAMNEAVVLANRAINR